MSARTLTEADYRDAATRLRCDVAAIKAVAEVESAGDGFLPDGRPKVLFERHWFSRFTGRAYDNTHPDISGMLPGGYEGGKAEHDRLERAMALDYNAALQAASWGRFQIMGFNHRGAGFPFIEEFIVAMRGSARAHLDAFVSFILKRRFDAAIRRRDWAGFARIYNGPNYQENRYHTRMALAYERYSAAQSEPKYRAAQTALAALGFDPGPIDGIWGKKSKAAAAAFGEAAIFGRRESQ